jgi:signal transduction histidine kinase
MLGLAESFKRSNIPDSSIYYSKLALNTAQEGGFAKYILKASNFLANYYESLRNIDSAYRYQSLSIIAKDSLFSNEKINQIQNLSLDEAERRQKNEAAKLVLKNRIKLYGLLTLLFVFFVIVFLQYKNNLEKKKTNLVLQRQKEEIQNTLLQLKATQSQLIQSEKMASLGELTAGIAHEIQNPLNFVNNFSEVNEELIGELKNELAMGNMRSANEIANTIKSNEQKINQHGKRADSIVKGMLQHSRASSGQREPTDINALADEYLKLTYHGLRAKDKSFNAKFETQFDPTLGKINVVPQDIGRVLLNLINNAFYAVTEKRRQLDGGYEPTVSIITRRINSSGDGGEKVEVTVKDNGNGIPHKVIDKIFQPFFTTKPAGSGTGLGLSLSYDIIKTHGGEISVQSTEGEGSEFVISLPC